jgi:hypothetical protein
VHIELTFSSSLESVSMGLLVSGRLSKLFCLFVVMRSLQRSANAISGLEQWAGGRNVTEIKTGLTKDYLKRALERLTVVPGVFFCNGNILSSILSHLSAQHHSQSGVTSLMEDPCLRASFTLAVPNLAAIR